ncbi:MAG: GGDEF domain-containing phosphodiesterase [Lachnospiraceae bacterium]|nr:GGDEF domain-containing phosphodiesterase [Lachnospiraceae bacterium]
MDLEYKRWKSQKFFHMAMGVLAVLIVVGMLGLAYLFRTLKNSLLMQGMTEAVVQEKMCILYTYSAGGILLLLVLLGICFFIQKRHNKDLEKVMYVDTITGGSTYEKFKQDVNEYLKKNTSQSYAIVSLDIDKSKYIEEVFGTEEYVKAVKFVWKALEEEVEMGEFCGHKEADQFYALLQYRNEEQLAERLERINDEVKDKIEQGDIFYDLKISVGIYVMNHRKHTIERMIYRSDVARKTVKGQHDKLYAFYTEEIKKSQEKNQEIENKMEKALSKGEFYVCYQPKYCTQDKTIVGAEALVRWRMNDGNMIPPSDFIPLFESNGFIKELDKYVFERVCKDVSRWLDKGLDVKPVSVNLSQMQLYNTNFIKEYGEILERYDLDSKYVQLELTETALFDNPVTLAKIINQLHSLGFEILMDDFGKGYSSLNMLKDVDVDTVKIDKSFVDDIGSNKKVERIIATIISLVRSLNMNVVAEGVENEMQYKFLNLVECDEIQGYYFSKPVEAGEYEKMLCAKQ